MARKKRVENNKDDFFSLIKDNMNRNPGLESLIKILAVFVLLFSMLIVGRVSVKKDRAAREEYKRTSTTTVASQQKSSYKTLIDGLIDKTLKAKVTINGNEYLFDNVKYKDETITGIYETEDKTTKFKIDNDSIYEEKLGNYIENKDLFGNIQMNFISISNLIKILESNQTLRTISDENVTYTYDLSSDDVNYEINVTIVQDEIVGITITNENENYSLSFE